MPVKWTAEVDKVLLLKILETHSISVDADAIAAAWPSDLGEKPTARAIKERIAKIRTSTKTAIGKISVSTAKKTTPSKPRTSITKKRTGKNEEDPCPPAKKQKETPHIKKEPDIAGDEYEEEDIEFAAGVHRPSSAKPFNGGVIPNTECQSSTASHLFSPRSGYMSATSPPSSVPGIPAKYAFSCCDPYSPPTPTPTRTTLRSGQMHGLNSPTSVADGETINPRVLRYSPTGGETPLFAGTEIATSSALKQSEDTPSRPRREGRALMSDRLREICKQEAEDDSAGEVLPEDVDSEFEENFI